MAPSNNRLDFRRAKLALSASVEDVLKGLGAKFVTNTRTSKFIFIETLNTPGATTFWVNRYDGSWCHEGKNVRGDIIALVGYVLRESPIESLRWAYKHLGWLEGGTDGPKPLSDREMAELEAQARAKAAKVEVDRQARAARLVSFWAKLPEAKGTVVETYLRHGRNIPLDLLSHFPNNLRFEAESEHLDEATGELTVWPAMVALLAKDGKRGGTGIHRTWLMPDGSDKAPVSKPKMMFGIKKGSAIRLTRGEGDYSPREAIAKGHTCPLILGEGTETTLSFSAFAPECRSWSVGDMGNMGNINWPPYASDVILLKDNNLHPFNSDAWRQVENAWATVEKHWRAQEETAGGQLIIATSDTKSDFNDELRG